MKACNSCKSGQKSSRIYFQGFDLTCPAIFTKLGVWHTNMFQTEPLLEVRSVRLTEYTQSGDGQIF